MVEPLRPSVLRQGVYLVRRAKLAERIYVDAINLHMEMDKAGVLKSASAA